MRAIVSTVLCCAPLIAGCGPSSSPEPPIVVVEGETLEGAYFDADRQHAVFKGVPYTAAPIGARI